MGNSELANNGSHLPWKEPRCLVESTTNDQLEVNEETLSMLQKITDPVVVVGIVGLYRTGKSYLMNRLAGQKQGFALGSTIQAKTKGIWVWCLPHPKRTNCCLVLLDTEGLGDIDKGDANRDMWIFALTVLLSSTMIYNSVGTINQQAVNELHFVTKMTEHIKIKSKGNDDESDEFVGVFPSFIWTVRDFGLQLEFDGKRITEDEYLERALKLQSGISQKVHDYNFTRECIRTYFPQRKCFVFRRPVEDQNMMKVLEKVEDSELDSEFLQQTMGFLHYVYESGDTKTINKGIVNGQLLGGLVKCYVDAIRNGDVPCIESAVETIAKVQNERAIKEALELYRAKFEAKGKFPTKTTNELFKYHEECKTEAAKHFEKVAIFDSKKEFFNRMTEEVESAYKGFVKKNKMASRRLLTTLHQKIEESIKTGKYTRSGGYKSYKTDMDSLVQIYRMSPEKGTVGSEEVLRDFIKRHEGEASLVRKTDEQITEEARKAKEETERARANERRRLVAEEELRKKEQLLADEKKRSERQLEEVRRRMQQEYEQERENLRRESERENRRNRGSDDMQRTLNVLLQHALPAYLRMLERIILR